MGFISTLEGLRPIRSNLIVEEQSTFWCSSCFKKIFKDWIGYVKKARECSLCGLWQLGEKPVSIFSGVLWTSRDLKWHSGSIVGKSILIFTVSRRIYCAWNRLPSESNGNPPLIISEPPNYIGDYPCILTSYLCNGVFDESLFRHWLLFS